MKLKKSIIVTILTFSMYTYAMQPYDPETFSEIKITRTYDIMSEIDMIKEYKNSLKKETYVDIFIKMNNGNGVTTECDFFSLLLSQAIQEYDYELIEEILKINEKETYPLLLLNTDKIQMSPISYALLIDNNEQIKAILKKYLSSKRYYYKKVILPPQALKKLRDMVGYQGEQYLECINDFINPILIEEQVNIIDGSGPWSNRSYW